MKILLAEDTKDLNKAVTTMLAMQGNDVDPAYDGEEAEVLTQANGYDLIILDIMMPKKNGLEVLAGIRERKIDTPVLMLTAKAEIDDREAKELEAKIRKAEFNFNDFLDQFKQIRKMGGLSSLLGMIPGMGSKIRAQDMPDEKSVKRIESIILSMTNEEREKPSIINMSRKNRIARGAGVDISEVNKLMKQFEQSKKMMKQMSGMMGKKGRFGGLGKLPF